MSRCSRICQTRTEPSAPPIPSTASSSLKSTDETEALWPTDITSSPVSAFQTLRPLEASDPASRRPSWENTMHPAPMKYVPATEATASGFFMRVFAEDKRHRVRGALDGRHEPSADGLPDPCERIGWTGRRGELITRRARDIAAVRTELEDQCGCGSGQSRHEFTRCGAGDSRRRVACFAAG